MYFAVENISMTTSSIFPRCFCGWKCFFSPGHCFNVSPLKYWVFHSVTLQEKNKISDPDITPGKENYISFYLHKLVFSTNWGYFCVLWFQEVSYAKSFYFIAVPTRKWKQEKGCLLQWYISQQNYFTIQIRYNIKLHSFSNFAKVRDEDQLNIKIGRYCAVWF